MAQRDLTREELFTLVWKRPATGVARDLEISDVALGKLCRRLQVPKPPRGYWARVKSGRAMKRPALAAFRETTAGLAGQRATKSARQSFRALVRLSTMQREFLDRALQELDSAGVDMSACDLAYDGIRTMSPDLAAQVLILIHRRYGAWIAEAGDTVRSRAGAYQRVGNLYKKLLPLAKAQLLILQRESPKGYSSDRDRSVIIRLSPELCRRIGVLYGLVRDHQLAYVAWDLQKIDHGWTFRYAHAPELHGHAVGELCVSEHEIWVRCTVETMWTNEEFETDRMALREILPVELLTHAAVELPSVMKRSSLHPYAKPLRALRDAERALEIVAEATYRMDGAVPDEHLVLVERLWFSETGGGPFAAARQAMDDLTTDLEQWDERLEAEKACGAR